MKTFFIMPDLILFSGFFFRSRRSGILLQYPTFRLSVCAAISNFGDDFLSCKVCHVLFFNFSTLNCFSSLQLCKEQELLNEIGFSFWFSWVA